MADDELKIKTENPDKKESETIDVITENIKSDVFSTSERKEIVDIVQADVDYAEEIQEDWVTQKELDLKHYHLAKPSELEGLTKKEWQCDRNLGLARAVADTYIATFFATCWTPDTINLVAVKALDIDNRQNQEKFIKWGMGQHEANAGPDVMDFIHNRVVVGTAAFKVYRKVWDEWVDRRIPVKNKDGETIRYEIKTEKQRFSKGVIENVPDIEDILMPEYGKNIQDLPYFIQVLHLDGESVIDLIDRGVFKPADKEEYKKKLYNFAYSEKKRTLGEEKLATLGISSPDAISDTDVRRMPIDLYEWYGYYTKGDKTERYRMIVDLTNEEFLSGKPVRKINRSGKIPFVVGSLSKEPGMVRGVSVMQTIAPIVNMINNVFCQKSDFQYVSNCPFGFYVPDEGYTQQQLDVEPGVIYPVSGDPQKSVYFPNLSRPMAWAESDIRIGLEFIERLTGAATFFQTNNKGVSGTATRDMLIDKNSETRFGIGVYGIQRDICEAINMWFELYQDYPPQGLAERVVGKDGEKLFRNLTIDALRGDTDVEMTPDTVAGSKMYRKQLQLWAFESAQQTVWLNPQINPAGNWDLTADTFKEVLGLSDSEVKRYLGERPKTEFNESDLDDEWYRFMNGEDFDPPEGATAMAQQHLLGHEKQKQEKYQDLPEEYRANFDAHIYKTIVNSMKFMKEIQAEAIANRIASQVALSGNPNLLAQQPVSNVQPLNTPGMGGDMPIPGQIAQPGASGAPGAQISPIPGQGGDNGPI
jgi:hypothetical protein